MPWQGRVCPRALIVDRLSVHITFAHLAVIIAVVRLSSPPCQKVAPTFSRHVSMVLPIAIDGFGGDHAPLCLVQGMSLVLARVPDLSFMLFGDESVLRPLLHDTPDLAAVTHIVHTTERITACAKPGDAVRMRHASMRLAIDAVKQGTCSAVVSAGNTGAYLALTKMILKTLKGIARPAIVSQIPHVRGESVFLDLGGNIDCDVRNLVEFGLMGACFARYVLKCNRPRVGLLNVGSESLKGPAYLQKASDILSTILSDFYGFVEGNDITRGTVDVVVADGFSGNVALKTAEGVADFFIDSLKSCLRQSLRGRLGYWMARSAFKVFAAQLDPRRYNGAFWLGVNGIAVKSHGGTDALGFSYAIEVAADIQRSCLNTQIAQEIEALECVETFKALRDAS